MFKIPDPPVMLIADMSFFGERLLTVVEECFEAGCRWAMVRGKQKPLEEVKTAARKILLKAEKHQAQVYVNSYAEIVAELDAHGVHLPQGFSVGRARRIVGEGKAVGVSVHSLDEALHAEKESADYVALSPVFPSISKHGYSRELGLEGIRLVSSTLSISVVALGGVRPGNAAACLQNGAKAVAVLGALSEKLPPRTVMRQIIGELKQGL